MYVYIHSSSFRGEEEDRKRIEIEEDVPLAKTLSDYGARNCVGDSLNRLERAIFKIRIYIIYINFAFARGTCRIAAFAREIIGLRDNFKSRVRRYTLPTGRPDLGETERVQGVISFGTIKGPDDS